MCERVCVCVSVLGAGIGGGLEDGVCCALCAVCSKVQSPATVHPLDPSTTAHQLPHTNCPTNRQTARPTAQPPAQLTLSVWLLGSAWNTATWLWKNCSAASRRSRK